MIIRTPLRVNDWWELVDKSVMAVSSEHFTTGHSSDPLQSFSVDSKQNRGKNCTLGSACTGVADRADTMWADKLWTIQQKINYPETQTATNIKRCELQAGNEMGLDCVKRWGEIHKQSSNKGMSFFLSGSMYCAEVKVLHRMRLCCACMQTAVDRGDLESDGDAWTAPHAQSTSRLMGMR